ncbi:MAG: L-lysine 6-transaminase [Melioribacteraceae bacterium]|jgi:L-lysine 6-transaminase|nr:L-lysine 6-transaminase [Melioribacteraceae bacterium]
MNKSLPFKDVIKKSNSINPSNVHETLSRTMLADGFDLVLDLERSHGLTIVNHKSGDEYLDFFSFFASSPIGLNHPKLNTPEYHDEIYYAAMNKPSNSDIYTVEMASFVDTFSRIAMPDNFKHLFFIDGGALAVGNALKVAFDWKVRKNIQKGIKGEKGTQVIHFREAFHGRSGYTLSLTNTDPVKIDYFPKFNWPRISNPKITFPLHENLSTVIQSEEAAITEIFSAIKNNKDDIAALIIEPVQAEGGDNFFRKEFFEKLREITLEHEILLIFDEVQTGIGMTGKMWAFEHYVEPDIICFGKKVQICGLMTTNRIDEVEDNVFKKSSRINSTWGGNLVDMIRSKWNLQIIDEDNLVENSEVQGKYLLNKLYELQSEFPNLVFQARGLGLMCSFNMPNAEIRSKFLEELYRRKLIMLGCGKNAVRFRTPLIVNSEEIDRGIKIIRETLSSL